MNAQLKSVLLTIATLSLLVIALIELSGVSSRALFNKYGIGKGSRAGREAEIREAAQRAAVAKKMAKTTMTFTEPTHHFGKIKEGEVVSHAFHFKNTGNAPLLIISAQASCGCTVPSFPKNPVKPGGEGDILVRFDSHNRPGHQQKHVLITSNAVQERMSIGFEVDVE
jgi:hypothetical protein